MVRSPLVGAVQLHQTDCPPEFPAWSGSPGSLVALMFELVAVMLVPVRMMRLAKRSFGGAWANTFTVATNNSIAKAQGCFCARAEHKLRSQSFFGGSFIGD